MNKLFTAFLLIYLDIDLHFGGSTLGLLPDFVGYIIMFKGLHELREDNPKFEKLHPLVTVLGVYTGVIYIMDLFGVFAEMRWLLFILGLAALALSAVVVYSIILCVQGIESARHSDYSTGVLIKAWRINTIAAFIVHIFTSFGWLRAIAGIVGAAAAILFLFVFYQTKERYFADSTAL